jgi:hypothetical protein
MQKHKKRVQVRLDEVVWVDLKIRARQQRTSISRLIQDAIVEKLARSPEDRRQALQEFVGIWKDRKNFPDSTAYVRRLRKGKRGHRIVN